MTKISPEIIHEDNHIIIVNKPPAMLSQTDKTGDIAIIDITKQYIKKKYNKPKNVFLQLPHRLDRPTSGVIMLAKTSKALERLNKMFKNNLIDKTYLAVVDKKPQILKAELNHYILKNNKNNKSKALNKPANNAKKASLTYELIGTSNNYFLLKIKLYTGRHHQIRAQLAKINVHIKGDLKYGAKRSNKDGSIHLHAYKLEFTHPVSEKKITAAAQPPHDQIWDNFFNIGIDN